MGRDFYSQNDKIYKNTGVIRYLVSGADARRAPRKWKRYVFIAILAAACIFALATAGISMYYVGGIIRPPLDPVQPIKQNIALPYSSVSFRSRQIPGSREDPLLLHGWHFPAEDYGRAVIIVHGFGGNRFPFAEDTLELIESLSAAGCGVLVFDLRNSGGADAGMSTFGLREKDDVLGAITYMRGAGYTDIVLYGISTGANAAALAGAETDTSEVGALILDSPVADTGGFIMYKIRETNPGLPDFPFKYEAPSLAGIYLNADVSDADIGRALEHFVPRPVLLIHGGNDEITSRSAALAVYDGYLNLAVGRITMLEVPGAGHAECFLSPAKDEYLSRVSAFIMRSFE